ncbi:MAG: ribosome maturation factor RimM [Catalinimonas sp.]
MRPEACFLLGYVRKPHGLRGEVSLFLDVDDPTRYEKMESVLVQRSEGAEATPLVPFFVEHVRNTGRQFLVKFADIDDVDAARALRGSALYLPLETLPKLDDRQFYYHEIIGFRVVDEEAGPLGEVLDVYDMAIQDLIAMRYREREVLIPIQDEIVGRVDRARREVYCRLPQGLLDVYLGDDADTPDDDDEA